MRCNYYFDNIKKLDIFINKGDSPCLPFSLNYFMFDKLINNSLPLTVSELYDKTILERQLWDRMCSQILREYMACDKFYMEV